MDKVWKEVDRVHMYDNSDPSNPVNIGYIAIPGNVDIAIKDGHMYADNSHRSPLTKRGIAVYLNRKK